jgi:hypothetical protein
MEETQDQDESENFKDYHQDFSQNHIHENLEETLYNQPDDHDGGRLEGHQMQGDQSGDCEWQALHQRSHNELEPDYVHEPTNFNASQFSEHGTNSSALPEGWEVFFDEQGSEYYFHHPTGIWRWDKPESSSKPDTTSQIHHLDDTITEKSYDPNALENKSGWAQTEFADSSGGCSDTGDYSPVDTGYDSTRSSAKSDHEFDQHQMPENGNGISHTHANGAGSLLDGFDSMAYPSDQYYFYEDGSGNRYDNRDGHYDDTDASIFYGHACHPGYAMPPKQQHQDHHHQHAHDDHPTEPEIQENQESSCTNKSRGSTAETKRSKGKTKSKSKGKKRSNPRRPNYPPPNMHSVLVRSARKCFLLLLLIRCTLILPLRKAR